MKGNVIGFDATGNAGAISGYDGQRYDFTTFDWHGQERPDFAQTASDVGGEQPPNVKKPITSTAPAVVLRSAAAANCRKPTRPVQLSPTMV